MEIPRKLGIPVPMLGIADPYSEALIMSWRPVPLQPPTRYMSYPLIYEDLMYARAFDEAAVVSHRIALRVGT